jgi:hypothetical protein
MLGLNFRFSAELWKVEGASSWHFVTLPKGVADEIRFALGGKRPGFGSVRVLARIGKTAWNTSVFPDAASGSYFLPIKATVRKAEKIVVGLAVEVSLDVEDHAPKVDKAEP